MKNEYAADAELIAPTTTELTTAKNLATAALEKMREIERIEETVIPQLKRELTEIVEDKLPTLMNQVGLSDFTIENGVKVSAGVKVFASLPNEEKDPEGFRAALAYLEELGGGDLAKRIVTIEFNKEDASLAQKAIELLNRTFNSKQLAYPVTAKVTVHWTTLTSWCRAEREKGNMIELAKLGGYAKNIASIKRPKGERS